MASQAFTQKLAAFKTKCQQILGPKRQGYGELSQLEQPLVSGNESDDAYLRAHGVPRPGGGGNLATGGRPAQYGVGSTPADISTLQTQELQDLIDLGKEAADILWEIAALQEEDKPGTQDILVNVKELQARLRGMVSDYSEGDERTLAQALEVFDRLSTSLEEYDKAVVSPRYSTQTAPTSAPSSQRPATLQPPKYQQNPYQPGVATGQTAPGSKAPAEEAPLISFD